MLTRLDHIVLIAPEIEPAATAYTALLGRGPDWETQDEASGTATRLFHVENTALEIMAPLGAGPVAARIKQLLEGCDGALTSLAFATDDITAAHHRLGRRGLLPSDITQSESTHVRNGQRRSWSRFRVDDSICAGIKTFILQRDDNINHSPTKPSNVRRLDHLVIQTPSPTRAIAHYAGRLGLRFALDRTIEAFHTRFLFFRIGGLTLEVIHRTDQTHNPDDIDKIWGLTWATDDLASAHKRLENQGVAVSDIRKGRKPGSQVFTVKSHTCGIPTLFIAHAPRD